MDSDPSIPYRTERYSPGGTRTVVYTIPDPPKLRSKPAPPPAPAPKPPRGPPPLDWAEESPSEYQPGGYLRIRISDRFAQRYRVVRKLGWGHFSTVWLAHDAQTSQHVALKVVKSAPRYSQTAADEIDLLQHVIDSGNDTPGAADHPGRDRLVTFLQAFKHTNPRSGQVHSCIAFEPLGMNLLQLIQQPEHKHRGIPLALCKQIARQTLQGLDYLHRVCGLVHTDLKPENILLRIAPSAVESHIRAELASSPPAIERSVSLGGKSHYRRDSQTRKHNSVYIIESQPLPSPNPSASLGTSWGGSARSQSHSWGKGGLASPSHAQFEQLALRMSKLVVDEQKDEAHRHLAGSKPAGSGPGTAPGSVGEKTSATSSCAASAIFSITGGSGCTSDTDHDQEEAPEREPASRALDTTGDATESEAGRRLSVLDGPSLLSRTAPLALSVTPVALPTPTDSGESRSLDSGADADTEAPRPSSQPSMQDDRVSVKIADLGNAARIGKHITDDIQTRQYRSPEVILRKPWGPAVDLFSLGCVVFELLTGDFLFEPKSREPLWSRDDDHICQMHEALGPFSRDAAQGGVFSKSIFRSDSTLRNVPARKINMWPVHSVLRDKYEFGTSAADEIDSFLRPILALDPAERASAEEAVEHPWLWS